MKCIFCLRWFLLSDFSDSRIACCATCGARPPRSEKTTRPTVKVPIVVLHDGDLKNMLRVGDC